MKESHKERNFSITTTLMRLSSPPTTNSNGNKLQLQSFFCKNKYFLFLKKRIYNLFCIFNNLLLSLNGLFFMKK